MELGGAERALLGLLEVFDKEMYEVDLFLMSHSGELMSFIPPKVNLLPEIPAYRAMNGSVLSALKNGHIRVAMGRLIGKIKAIKKAKQLGGDKCGVAIEYSHKYTCFAMPMISQNTYDLAISFLTPHYFVAQKVKAKKKIAWIHTDYNTLSIDVSSETKMWAQYDHIISISEDVTQSFIKVFPGLRERIVLIENIMPMSLLIKQVKQKSVEEEMPSDNGINLLSIGRFSPQKRMVAIPEICSRIRKHNLDVKWYIIGFGKEEELIKAKIKEFNMQDYVIMLGKKDNPYPYINSCDVYVQPSLYEGKSVAVREAQILHKPVIITDYSTSKSQLENGYDGLIVPIDIPNCAEAIAKFLQDTNLQKFFIHNTMQRDYTNKNEINKVYEFL